MKITNAVKQLAKMWLSGNHNVFLISVVLLAIRIFSIAKPGIAVARSKKFINRSLRMRERGTLLFLLYTFQNCILKVDNTVLQLTVSSMHIGSLVAHWQKKKKKLPANAGDMDLTPGLLRSLGEGNGNPFKSCLGNPMDRGASWVTVHGVAKSQT